LSYNKLTAIEGLEGLLINELNLEGNQISSLTGLAGNPRLSALNIARNRVTSLAPLESCLQLHNIDASGNLIRRIRQVEFLKGLKWLKLLNLSENPSCVKCSYR
jgi:Leucine-rich repeat (LRR) protein